MPVIKVDYVNDRLAFYRKEIITYTERHKEIFNKKGRLVKVQVEIYNLQVHKSQTISRPVAKKLRAFLDSRKHIKDDENNATKKEH